MSSEPSFLTLSAPGEADSEAETRQIFSRLSEAVTVRGEDLEGIVWLRILYREYADFPKMTNVRKPLLEAAIPELRYPATTGVVTGPRPDGCGMRFQAILAGGKQLRDTKRVWKEIKPGESGPVAAAQAVEWNDVLMVSGQVGFNLDSVVVGPTAREQEEQAMRNLWAICDDAGFDRGNAAAIIVYLTRPAWEEAMAVMSSLRGRFVAEHPQRQPLITLVCIEELFMPDVLIEIEAYFHADAPGGSESTGARRAGSLVFAAEEVSAASAEEAWRAALDGLAGSLPEVDSSLDEVVLLTVWHSGPVDARELEALVRHSAELPAGLPISVVPDARAADDEPRVQAEAIAYGR